MSVIDYFATKVVPRMYRGKGALHPTETGHITDSLSCVREWDVNIFFIRKGDTIVAIDSGYKDHPALLSECAKVGIDPAEVRAVLLTHVDPDHAGGLDVSCENHFTGAQVYLGKIEENYLTNTYHRKRIGPFGLKNSVTIAPGYKLLEDGDAFRIGEIEVKAFLVPGHTLGHMAYLVDSKLLFTGDSIALNKDGGWCFFGTFNYDSQLNKSSLRTLERRLEGAPITHVLTSHNGYTTDSSSAFAHIGESPDLERRGFVFDEDAPYDCFA